MRAIETIMREGREVAYSEDKREAQEALELLAKLEHKVLMMNRPPRGFTDHLFAIRDLLKSI